MRPDIVSVFALLVIGSVPASDTVRPDLGQKLTGVWNGQSGCAGNFVFRADGTYELTGYGPVAEDSKGTWKLHGDVVPARLILTCTKSDLDEEVGKSIEIQLLRIDDDTLILRRGNQLLDRYGREKK